MQGRSSEIGEILSGEGKGHLDAILDGVAKLLEKAREPEGDTLIRRLIRQVPQPALHLAQAPIQRSDHVQRVQHDAAGHHNGFGGVEPTRQRGDDSETLAGLCISDGHVRSAWCSLHQFREAGQQDTGRPSRTALGEKRGLGREFETLSLDGEGDEPQRTRLVEDRPPGRVVGELVPPLPASILSQVGVAP
jgi:hypothetical protein